MKKLLFCLIFMCLLLDSFSIFAQKRKSKGSFATSKGDAILDIGVGFFGGYYDNYHPSYYYTTGPHWNYSRSTSRVSIPTLSISLQKAIHDDVTIGGQISFNAFGSELDYIQSDGYYQHSKYNQTNTFITARGEYHFNRLIGWDKKYDLYAGALAGMRFTINHEKEIYEGWGSGQPGTWRTDYPDHSSSDIGPTGAIFGGMRYYFTGNMAVYAELGVGITNFRTGLAWKL